MQITLNQNEVEGILAAHAATMLPHIEPEDVTSVQINEDGTALVIIGEEVHEDTPPVVEKQKRTRRTRNPAEAKHVPVEAKKELEQLTGTQTNDGGQKESSTLVTEPEDVQTEGDNTDPTEQLKEEVTAEAKEAASQEVAEEAAVQEKVQEKVVETTAAKPSLFANLKR